MCQQLIDFTVSVLKEARIPARVIASPIPDNTEYDRELRSTLFALDEDDSRRYFQIAKYTEHLLSHITDAYFCEYFLLKLPSSDPKTETYLFAGPFAEQPFDVTRVYEICARRKIPESLAPFLDQYYTSLSVLTGGVDVDTLFYTLTRYLYPQKEDIQLYRCREEIAGEEFSPGAEPIPTQGTTSYLEAKYASEDRMMEDIRTGNLKRIDEKCSRLHLSSIKQHWPDSLRDQKNNLLIFNMLCRKAGESAQVHPVYLDDAFNSYSYKIEYASTLRQLNQIYREIPRRYCLLVRMHSLQGYSPIIQKIISHIDFNLTEDLSLSHIAECFSLNRSYLSQLFKKETGTTLTSYVNHRKVEHAVSLMNTTSLSTQEIAAQCGLENMNYFIRLFKKETGITPGKYREELANSDLAHTFLRYRA